MTGQALIECVEKEVAIVGVILPRVLPIHDDGKRSIGLSLGGVGDALQVLDEIGDGIIPVPVPVREANEIG